MVTRSEPDYAWDFCGGDLAIDFTNTVGSRGEEPEEHFNVYGDVLSWAEAHGVLSHARAHRLASDAGRDPAAARAALTSMRSLRESLYRVLAAAADGRRAPAGDLDEINDEVAAACAHAKLAARDGAYMLTFDAPDTSSLTQPIVTPVVRAAIDLLTGGSLARVRRCADASCGWLFLDATRSGTRRWCDMAVCGNRSKVRRFRRRGNG